MKSRPRKTFLATTVAVVLIMLGTDIGTQSAHTASPATYPNFLLSLPAARNGISLMQSYKSLERSMNILKNIPLPGPRIIRQISSFYKQEVRVFSNVQKNINALIVSRGVLEKQYQTLETQKELLLSRGRISQAQRVAVTQGQVYNKLNSLLGLVSAEKGLATPVR